MGRGGSSSGRVERHGGRERERSLDVHDFMR